MKWKRDSTPILAPGWWIPLILWYSLCLSCYPRINLFAFPLILLQEDGFFLPLPRLRGHSGKLYPCWSLCAPSMSPHPSTSLVSPKTLFGASPSFMQVPMEIWPPLRGKGWLVDASHVLPTTTVVYPRNFSRRISRRGLVQEILLHHQIGRQIGAWISWV